MPIFFRRTLLAVFIGLCLAPAALAYSPLSAQAVNPAFSRALQTHQLLALGDVHGSTEVVGQLQAFLEDESHWRQVDDIVVEFGNARYQELADRYLLGDESIPLQQLRPIWRDTLYFMAWQYAAYEELVVQLQQWNRVREHRVRLVLAEPAFDWGALGAGDWQQLVDRRELGYLQAVEQQVIKPRRRAILLFGAFHTMETLVRLNGRGEPFESLVALLEKRHPGSVYTVWPRMSGDGVKSAGEIQGAAPYLVPLASTGLGARPINRLTRRIAEEGAPTLAQVADAYLYLSTTDRNAPVSDAALADNAWHAEMRRRAGLVDTRASQQILNWLDRLEQ